MALSQVTMIATGANNMFAVSFALGYGQESEVTARVGDEVDGDGNPVYRTIDFSVAGFMILDGALIVADTPVVFTRTENKTTLDVDWEDGANVTDENLNASQLQSLRLIHELFDGRFDKFALDIDAQGNDVTGIGTLSADRILLGGVDISQTAEDAAAAAASAAAAAASAEHAEDVLDAVNTAIEEVTPDKLQFVGDGVTTHFPLGRSAAMEVVDPYISGVYQQQETFSISGTGAATEIVFAVAPPAPTVALAPNIEIRFGGQSSLASSILVPGQVDTTALANGAVTDPKVANYNRLFSAIWDEVVFTNYLGHADVDSYRSGGNPDITQGLQDMNAAMNSGARADIPFGRGIISATVNKNPATGWYTTGVTVGLGVQWTAAYNGDIIKITGTGVSTDGAMEGMRIIGNNVAYPLSKAINAENVFTHRFKNMRIGGFQYGLYQKNAVAHIHDNLYIFNCLLDGQHLEGDTPAQSSDNRWYDCQFTGDRAGLYLKNTVTPRLVGCRPQGSGLYNLYAENVDHFKFHSGFCDSAVIHPSGGGEGMRFIHSSGVVVSDTTFYSNGNGKPHMSFYANSADPLLRMEYVQILDNRFLAQSGQTGVSAITIHSPTGSGSHRYYTIDGNDFNGANTAIIGLNNIDVGLSLGTNNGVDSSISPVQTIINPVGTIAIDARTETVRITGTVSSTVAIVVTGKGNYFGKQVKLVRSAGGAGLVNVRGPDSTTLIGTLPAAGSRLEVYCTSQNVDPTLATFSEV